MKTYNVFKRREHEHDHPSQLYARVQSPGRLRGVNGSQERKRSLSPLPTEAGSRLQMEGSVSGRGGHGLRQGSPNDPALARVAELERLVGRLTLELEVSKKASSLLEAHLSKGGK